MSGTKRGKNANSKDETEAKSDWNFDFFSPQYSLIRSWVDSVYSSQRQQQQQPQPQPQQQQQQHSEGRKLKTTVHKSASSFEAETPYKMDGGKDGNNGICDMTDVEPLEEEEIKDGDEIVTLPPETNPNENNNDKGIDGERNGKRDDEVLIDV